MIFSFYLKNIIDTNLMIFIEYSLKKELYFLLYDYICAITDINLNTRRLLNILYNYFAQKQGFFLRRF